LRWQSIVGRTFPTEQSPRDSYWSGLTMKVWLDALGL
jgi:hypothetical protein